MFLVFLRCLYSFGKFYLLWFLSIPRAIEQIAIIIVPAGLLAEPSAPSSGPEGVLGGAAEPDIVVVASSAAAAELPSLSTSLSLLPPEPVLVYVEPPRVRRAKVPVPERVGVVGPGAAEPVVVLLPRAAKVKVVWRLLLCADRVGLRGQEE